MAKKAKKSAPRKRSTTKRTARRSRRRSPQRSALAPSPMTIVKAIGGAMIADYVVEKLPIKEEKTRLVVATAGFGLLMLKGPAELKAVAFGAAVKTGGTLIGVAFPKLLPKTGATKTIGRLDAREEDIVRKAIEYRMQQGDDAMNGTRRFSPVTGPQYSPVTGMKRRRFVG